MRTPTQPDLVFDWHPAAVEVLAATSATDQEFCVYCLIESMAFDWPDGPVLETVWNQQSPAEVVE